jgi:hypothetical protein
VKIDNLALQAMRYQHPHCENEGFMSRMVEEWDIDYLFRAWDSATVSSEFDVEVRSGNEPLRPAPDQVTSQWTVADTANLLSGFPRELWW